MLAALAAFTLWGVLPVFWKWMAFLPAPVVVAQRTVWSLLFLLAVVWGTGKGREWKAALCNRRAVAIHLVSGLLLSINWVIYVWATQNGRIIEGALGYYHNPFFNMLFGVLWFGEKHARAQLAAIALALVGVALQIPAVGHFPAVALALGVSFSLYAVVRKLAPLEALVGLTLETTLLVPLAIAWLIFHSRDLSSAFGSSPGRAALVVCSGCVTAIPLLCFGFAARKIRLATLGILQFLGPTIQFFIGWLIYREPMTPVRLISFALIWLAVGLYVADSLRKKPVLTGS